MGRCIVCGKALPQKPLITFDRMPASAQDLPNREQLETEKGISLSLYSCNGCGLVQFDCKPVSYYRDVIRSGGYSTTMVELRRKQYSHLIDKYNLTNKKFLEVGCGRGEFLSVLKEFPVETYGIENNAYLVQEAHDQGLNVRRQFMENGESVVEGGPFDVFLSFNFLEHQPDPNGMLEGIYNNLTDEGMGLVTVPSFEYIVENNGYYELLRDHIANYTFDTLRFLLNKNGFVVLEEEMINRDTISMIVRKRGHLNVLPIMENYERICSQVNEYIDTKKRDGKDVAIWGASHQGFTLAATAQLGEKVEYVIDSAPFKQGKYAPASHIPIVSPEEAKANPTDAIIIIAPGYVKEIADVIRREFQKQTEIMVLMARELEKYIG